LAICAASITSGEAADFSLSHGAAPLAAEQVLSDIGTFEAERDVDTPPERQIPASLSVKVKAAKR
jgi:hypothetical protein